MDTLEIPTLETERLRLRVFGREMLCYGIDREDGIHLETDRQDREQQVFEEQDHWG